MIALIAVLGSIAYLMIGVLTRIICLKTEVLESNLDRAELGMVMLVWPLAVVLGILTGIVWCLDTAGKFIDNKVEKL